MGRLFGTDGVRGIANRDLSCELAFKIGAVGAYVLTNELMKTNIAGVYAAGDIRNTTLRQVITACADGAIAGTTALEFGCSH